MHTQATPPPPLPMRTPIAHWTHALTLILLLFLIGLSSHLRAASPTAQATPVAARYLSTSLYEWLLLGSVIAGIYNRRAFFTSALTSAAISSVRH